MQKYNSLASTAEIACFIDRYMQEIVEDIRFSDFNQDDIAKALGIRRETLNRKLKDPSKIRGDELLTTLIVLGKIKVR